MIDLVPLFGLIFLLAFFYFFVAGFFRSPFVPANRKTVEKMLAAAKLRKGERVIDLGCGDGRIIFLAEQRYGVTAEGYEVSTFVWLLAQLNRLLKHSQAKIYRKNFFKADLAQADIVFCYLLPEVMRKLAPKLKQELKQGARIVSASFSLPDWEAVQVYEKEGGSEKVFVYRR
ncbi:MAG: 50S ribosomal protein L11 methyltransferase [Patescibacteria group bacterium]